MTAWHREAEDWGVGLAIGALPDDVPIVRYVPTDAAPAAAQHCLVGPASMTAADIAMDGQRITAVMSVDFWLASAGDTPAAISRLATLADALIVAAAQHGARRVSTQTRASAGTDRRSTYVRIVSCEITVTGNC